MSSLKASPEGLRQIKAAREERGWAIDDPRWLDEISKYLPERNVGGKLVPDTLSIGTWRRFLGGKEAIKKVNFCACCEALGLNWQEIAEGNFQEKSTQTQGKETQSASDRNFYVRKLDKSQRLHYGKTILSNASLTLYAFHLRTSTNCQLVPEASHLWEKLVEFGNLLEIEELQHLQKKLICYRDSQYNPEAEELQELEQLTLLQDGENVLRFSSSPELKGLLCPFRLHDSYAIDLTIYSDKALGLEQLTSLNPQYLPIPSQVESSLGQTLLFFAEHLGDEEDYQALADACIAWLIPESEHNLIELIAEGSFLGNPIFEYESTHRNQSKRLHILSFFECKNISLEKLDELSKILLYIFWLRHKIIYVYEQSRLCVREAKLLSAQIEPSCLNENLPSFLELQKIKLEYTDYIRNLRSYQTTIDVNGENYRIQMEKLAAFPDSDFKFLGDFLSQKFNRQIEVDLSYLEPGKERLQHLLAVVKANPP